MLSAIACGPVVAVDDGDSSTSGVAGTTVATIGATSIDAATTPTPDPEVTDAVATTAHGEQDTSSSGAGETCSFICDDTYDESGGNCINCNPWDDSCCGDDEKCVAWANDGGNQWNALRCAPVDDAPAALGEPCTVEGSFVSGLDSCVAGQMCFWVDPLTNLGTCVAGCEGSETNPTCGDPATQCVIDFDDAIALCLPSCDPHQPDCEHGSCVATTRDDVTSFVCGMELPPAVAHFEPCGHHWSCAVGSLCADDGMAAACADGPCCAPICDPALRDPCTDGRVCTAAGYCALP